MGSYLANRLAQAAITLLAMTMLIFTLGELTGDVTAYLIGGNEYTTLADYERVKKEYGLDKNPVERYGQYLWDLLRGDLGNSRTAQQPVVQVIREKLPVTMKVGLSAAFVSVIVGIPIGVLSAVKRGSVWDAFGRTFALLGQAIPTFWLALILIILLGVRWNLLPITGYSTPLHLIMPVIALAHFPTAGVVRITRSAMLEVLETEYVKLARSKGVSESVIVWKHAFRNVQIPLITFIGLLFAGALTGAVVTESIFGLPGLGRAVLQGATQRDFPLLQGIVLFSTCLYLLINLIIDASYAFLDPRIKHA